MSLDFLEIVFCMMNPEFRRSGQDPEHLPWPFHHEDVCHLAEFSDGMGPNKSLPEIQLRLKKSLLQDQVNTISLAIELKLVIIYHIPIPDIWSTSANLIHMH